MSAQPAVDTGMTLVEHLTELRKRLIICALAVLVGMLVGFVLYEWVFDFLIAPYKDIATADNAVVPGKLVVFDRSRASRSASRHRPTPASPSRCR
jgi:Sec-independent protein secretion pathway component TatC